MYYVTDIKKMPSGKYNVVVNDAVTLSLYGSEIRKYNIEPDTEIPQHIYEDEILNLLYKRCRERSLYIIENSLKTEQELRAKLLRVDYPPGVVDETIALLKEYGYIDDLRYAEQYFNCKNGLRSAMQIKFELMRKGVNREVIEVAAEKADCDETEAVKKLIEKKRARISASDRNAKNKIYTMLRRKGFNHDAIVRGMADVL